MSNENLNTRYTAMKDRLSKEIIDEAKALADFVAQRSTNPAAQSYAMLNIATSMVVQGGSGQRAFH